MTYLITYYHVIDVAPFTTMRLFSAVWPSLLPCREKFFFVSAYSFFSYGMPFETGRKTMKSENNLYMPAGIQRAGNLFLLNTVTDRSIIGSFRGKVLAVFGQTTDSFKVVTEGTIYIKF